MSSSSPRIGGEQLVAAVAGHYGAWLRASPSSLEAFSHARNVPASCGTSGRRGDCCRAYCPLRLTGRSAEGAADGGPALVNGRTVFEGYSHAPRRSCRGGSTKIWSGMSAQRVAGLHSTGNGVTATGVGGRDSGHACYAAWLLTASDPRHAMEWLAINAPVR